MTTYRDLFDKFSNGHNRLLAAMGQQAFQNQVLAKFPLTLSDEDVRNLAVQFGWQEEGNQTKMSKRAKAKAAIAPSSDVGQMLSGHLSQVTGQVPPQVPQQSRPGQVHQMVPPVQMPPPVLQPPPPPAHRLQVPQQPQQMTLQQQHPVHHQQVPQRVHMQQQVRQQPPVQVLPPGTPAAKAAAHPIPVSFSKSAPTTPRNPRNLDGQFLAVSGAAGHSDGAAMPRPSDGAAVSGPSDDGAQDFIPSLMALMDASPTPPESVLGDEVEGSGADENEHAALCCICHDVLIAPGVEVEALGCGHVFHCECLSQCSNVGGFSNHWCPFKCHESTTDPALRNVAPEDDSWKII